MSRDNDLESLFTRTPGPRVVAGSHRAGLKAELLRSMRKEHPVKTLWKPLLVACCVVVLLTAGGLGPRTRPTRGSSWSNSRKARWRKSSTRTEA